jgi:hypothetical protein
MVDIAPLPPNIIRQVMPMVKDVCGEMGVGYI